MAQITVSTTSELQKALQDALEDDTILLAAGDYGALAMNNPARITLKSADKKCPARFTRITLNNPANVALIGFEVSYTPAPGEGNSQIMLRVNNGSNVMLDSLYVHGVMDGEVAGDVNGISCYNVEGLTVSNCRIVEINAGIKIDRCRKAVVRGNDISYIGSDGIEIPGCDGMDVFRNKIYNFRTNNGIHPDGIQCWTTGQTSGCKNVRIFCNEITGTPGHEPQGIFFGDEARVGGYENIEITGNRFACTMWHAINIYSGPKNVAIRFNEVTGGPNFQPWIRVDAPAVCEGNIAPGFYINSAVASVPAGNYLGS